MKKNKNGFTLFELLVSISIIAILTALASVAFSGAQKKARDARRMEDIKAIQVAAEQYYSQNTYLYPDDPPVMPWKDEKTNQSILDTYPTDPKTGVAYDYINPFGGVANTYCVCALLENTTGGNASDASCTFATGGSYFCAKNQQ